MNIGIIGFGSIGKRHADNLQRHSDVGIVILSQRTDIENEKVVSSWEDFELSGPYDGIFVTNETSKHVDTLKKVTELKPKAIFIEKPLSHNVDGLDEVKERLKQENISVWVAYNFQFFEPFLRIKEIIKSGQLGKVYSMRVFVGQDLSEWRPRDYRQCYSSKKDGGGGVMLDLVHDINYPAWLLDDSLSPKICVAKKVSDLDIDTEDCAESILVSSSGVVVSVHQDYLRIPYKRSLDIVGSEASLNWNSDSNTIIVENKDKVLLSEEINKERNNMYEKEVDFFVDVVRKGNYFSNIEEGIHDVFVIEKLKAYEQNN